MTSKNGGERVKLGRFEEIMPVPNLLAVQKDSFDAFLQKDVLPENRQDTGLQGVFKGVFPIYDTTDVSYLDFVNYTLGTPKLNPDLCRERGESYAAPLKTTLRLVACEKDKEKAGAKPQVKDIREQEVYLCDLPLMTENGTFIINGAERVVVSQLHRSPGLVFERDVERSQQTNSKMFVARIIPYRGIWLEFEFDLNGIMHAKIDRRKKVLATTLLRALPGDFVRDGDEAAEAPYPFETDERILRLFYDVEEVVVAERIPEWNESSTRSDYRVTASAIADPDTGEIIAGANRRVMRTKDGKLLVEVADQDKENEGRKGGAGSGRKAAHTTIAGVEYVEREISAGLEKITVLVDYREDDFSICDTLKAERVPSQKEKDELQRLFGSRAPFDDGARAAVVELHQKMAPTVPFNRRSAEEVVRSNFLGYLGKRLAAGEGGEREKKCKYDLGEVGRIKMDECLGRVSISLDDTVMKPHAWEVLRLNEGEFDEVRNVSGEAGEALKSVRVGEKGRPPILHIRCMDIAKTMKSLVKRTAEKGREDDIDHLGNRRVRAIGELLENQFRIGFSRVVKQVRGQMSLLDLSDPKMLPTLLLNTKPFAAAVKGFFASSQLCQFMDQTNPLAEITHKRRLSALGPGGLTRERAGFEVRDVHDSHYGRVCPIETPEGPNIGLISSLATYARINRLGFLETPYRRVADGVVSRTIDYLDADDEYGKYIVMAKTPVDKDGKIDPPVVLDEHGKPTTPLVWARHEGEFVKVPPSAVDYIEISPKQLVSVATALIPFLEHDDANRALMGSNMQRQAVPLVRTERPRIGTGLEGNVARDSGMAVVARRSGTVAAVDATRIVMFADTVRGKDGVVVEPGGVDTYDLVKFQRSNQSTCLNQKPLVKKGQAVKAGEVLADGPAMSEGELALGAEVLVAFMPWRGYNFEDAVVISERLLKEDTFSSIHMEEYEEKACETKLGPEEITRDVPNLSEEALRNIEEDGLARVGAEVVPGDILVSRVAPKGETEQTPEDKLLRAIFGAKAEDVRDTSVRVPPGVDGKVLRKKLFSRKSREDRLKGRALAESKAVEKEKQARIEACNARFDSEMAALTAGKAEPAQVEERKRRLEQWRAGEIEGFEREADAQISRIKRGDELPQTILKLAKLCIAKKRRIMVGDKVAGRHGNKGVVAKILPVEDMPHLADGTPVDMVLNPLGVPSRMNMGQIYEAHMGWAAHYLGRRVECPVFDGASEGKIWELHAEAAAKHPQVAMERGKTLLYDGCTGEPFDRPVTVGYLYMMKLGHMVEGKIHARSIGPYSLVSQQPLGGKAQRGGQRFGEMEVWALEGYGAAHTLQEMLTVKSDDVTGRSKAYEALVKGQNVPPPGVPQSFNVLVNELQSLGLNVEISTRSGLAPRFPARRERAPESLREEKPEKQEVQ